MGLDGRKRRCRKAKARMETLTVKCIIKNTYDQCFTTIFPTAAGVCILFGWHMEQEVAHQ